MSTKKTNASPQPSVDGAFLRMMQTHQKGQTLSDLSEAVRKVTEAVGLYFKPGTVTLKINILPATKSADGAFGVNFEVTEKIPKGDSFTSLFFSDEKNNLVRENPNQQTLPQLRTIKGGAAEDETQPLKKLAEQQP